LENEGYYAAQTQRIEGLQKDNLKLQEEKALERESLMSQRAEFEKKLEDYENKIKFYQDREKIYTAKRGPQKAKVVKVVIPRTSFSSLFEKRVSHHLHSSSSLSFVPFLTASCF
jgi:hypothetical protein